MKKRNLTSLALNKKSISKFEVEPKSLGGRGISVPLTVCRNDYCVSVLTSCPVYC